MSKILSRYINYGSTSDPDQVNDGKLPSVAPSNPTKYTPAQVGSEGNDKTSAHLNGINTALERVTAQNTIWVKKNPGKGEFSSIKAAVDSISGNSSTNLYIVRVGPGVFQEDTITTKPYVIIKGTNRSTIVQPDSPSKDIFVATDHSTVADIVMEGATDTGSAAISMTNGPAGGEFNIFNCVFRSNDHFVRMDSSGGDARIVIHNCEPGFDAEVTTPFHVFGTGVGFLRISDFSGTLENVSTSIDDLFLIEGGGNRVLTSNCVISLGGSSGTNAIRVNDGGEFDSTCCLFDGFDTGIYSENTGSAPTIRATGMSLQSTNFDINIEHPGTQGFFSGGGSADRIFVDDNSPFALSLIDADPANDAGLAIVGSILQADKFSQLLDLSTLGRAATTMGRLSGGEIQSSASSLDITVAAGNGFLLDESAGFVKEINWAEDTITLPANSAVFVYVNENGNVSINAGQPDLQNKILLGRVSTLSTGVTFVEDVPMNLQHFGNSVSEFQRKALGPIFARGCVTTESSTGTRNLDVTNGSYWYGSLNFQPSGGSNIFFDEYYRDGSGGWVVNQDVQSVNNSQWDDGSGTLASLSAGNFAKHALYVVGDGSNNQFFLVLSQVEFDSLVEAEEGSIPTPPPDFGESVTLIASVIVREGQASIEKIIDNRPVIGFRSGATSAVSDHGNLLGLFDDDHPQYLLSDGSRSMSGNLDMGSNNIANVGTVDGVTVSAHASRHLPNGSDPIATAVASGLDGDTSNAEGVQNSFARSDHIHDIATGVVSTQTPDQTNAEGTSANLARADHIHNIPAASAVGLDGDLASAEGTSTSFARADHTHEIATGVVVSQTPDQVNAEGTSPNLARADHIHNIAAAAPVTIGTANSEGTSTSFARADHVHDHGSQGGGSLHALATDSTAGFLSATLHKGLGLGLATGWVSGGSLTRGTGLDLDVSSGTGYVIVSGVVKEVVWGAQTITLADESGFFVWVNDAGTVQSGASAPDAEENIILGSGHTDNGGIPLISEHVVFMSAPHERTHNYVNDVIGPVTISGGIATVNGTNSLSIDVDSATFYIYDNKKVAPANTQITFTYWYRDGAGGWNATTSNTEVNPSQYDDGSGTLAAIPAGEWKKDALYVAVAGGVSEYHIVYAQETFPDQSTAEAGDLPVPPVELNRDALRLAGAVIQEGATSIGSIVDERPFIGQLSTGATSSSDHGNLGGLGDDDHPQYLLADGTRAMSGSLDMGTNNIINVGTVDGVDVSAHASRHLPSGADPLATAAATGLDGDTSNTEGVAESFARSDHTHAIATGTPITQGPDNTNAEGTSANLARSDHAHDIPTATASGLDADTSNTQGVASSFARSDHTHAVADGVVTDITTIAPDDSAAAGTAPRFARADHQHAIAAAVASTQTPDQANAEGVSTSFARADHIHNIPAEAPVTTLTADTANTEGTAGSFARSDHVHAVAAGTVGEITTIQPDDAVAAGTSANLARADHQHAIVAATPVTLNPDQANAEGTATSFARSDHVHNVPAAVAVTVSNDTNAEGVSASFARADHTHKITQNSPTTGQHVRWDGSNWNPQSIVLAYGEAEAEQTTTSTTFVQALSVSVSIPTNGDYLIEWSWEASNDSKDRDTVMRVQVDDSTTIMLHSHARQNDQIADPYYGGSGFRRMTLSSGTRTIDFDFRAGAGTARVRRVRVIVKRLD